ncbi:MAG: NlpC/P60 family protein [Pseudomonadales bacterium]
MHNLFMTLKHICMLLVCLLIVGCAGNGTKVSDDTAGTDKSVNPLQFTEQQLLGYFSDWEGTPYRLGGNSRKGIDCSAYVRNAYRDVFNMEVPRTTLGQATLGKKVDRKALIPGDLVLFKTSRTSRHVGVVVNGDKFMHVSEMKGVIISDLNNVYWRKKYWKAVRPNNGLQL